jgi:hypothetical protein
MLSFRVPFKGLVPIDYECQYLEQLSLKMKDLKKLRSWQMETNHQVSTGGCLKNEVD